jgi:hypothetical protein
MTYPKNNRVRSAKTALALAYVVIEGMRPTQMKKNYPTLKNRLRCCVGKSVGRRNASYVRKANEKEDVG